MRPAGFAVLAGVLLVAGGGTVAAVRFPAAPAAVPRAVTLPAVGAAAVPVCPGPETLVTPQGGQPVPAPGPVLIGAAVLPAADPLPAPATFGATSPAGAVISLGDLGDAPMIGSREGLAVLTVPRPGAGPVALRTAPAARPPALSSVQVTVGRSGDLRGLAALACPAAAAQTWLVGGGTQPGRRGRLLLANPSAAPAVVDVTVLGPHGPVSSSAGSGVVVAAGGQRALLIDALAPDLDAVAVHVQARTGRVVATLHDSYLRGLVPAGVDDVTAAAPAARRQVVPGVSIDPAPGAALPASPRAPGAVAVRVVNPGAVDAVVRVRLLGRHGEQQLPGGVRTVPAGAVLDVPVTRVPAGDYAAVVDADVPVLAGALIGRTVAGGQAAGTAAAVSGAVPPSELAWAASVPPLDAPGMLAVPTVPGGRSTGPPVSLGAVLTATATGAAGRVDVRQIDRNGHPSADAALDVPAGSTARLVLAADVAAVLVTPAAGSAAVTAALVLQVQDPAGSMLSVLPLRAGSTGTGPRPTVVADARLGLRIPTP